MTDLPLERSFALAVKIQSGRGVDAEPTMAANAVRLAASFEPTMDWVSRNETEGEQTGGKGTYPSGAKAGRIYRFPLRRRMRGPGTAYSLENLPEEDAFLMAVLGNRTVDTTPGSESVTYSGVDEGEALLTVLAQSLKKQFKATDCVPASASIQWESAKFIELVIELMGVGLPPTQQALQAANLDTVTPPVGRGGVFTLNSVALKPIKGNLDFGLQVADPILDGSAGDAWIGSAVADRRPSGNFEVQVRALTDFDPYALAAASTPVPWVYDFGGAQYNNVRLEADKLEIRDVKEVNRGGIKAWSLDYTIHRATSPSTKDPVVILK